MLQKDLKKIDPYVGNDTVKCKEIYTWLCEKYNSEEERKQIDDYVENALKALSTDIGQFITETSIKIQLAENAELLPLAYIARTYFHKTKNWLYQRVNGNTVNGKPAHFTPEEKELFNHALQDISKKIGSIRII
ncbi:MAG: DUF5053 domain-containing protein [Tannerellaceae bacterium]|nr:DUF5053 domain-containing protein [Tannerellaceae bacterium]